MSLLNLGLRVKQHLKETTHSVATDKPQVMVDASRGIVFRGFWVYSRDMTFNIPDLKMTEVVVWAEELLH